MNLKVFLLSCLATFNFVENVPIAVTSLGKIRGSIMKSQKNRDILAFRGIPFAESPLGEYRFERPIAKFGWGDSVLDATKDGFLCPQIGTKEMSEDCLVLNVYTSDLLGNKSVMFFIHGGANSAGSGHSSAEGPRYLLDYDVVLVTINYRLGVLGYLSSGTNETSSNNGFLDQIMALQWVHDHISNFGGNPDSVTLFGMSTGSGAATTHMVSPLSKGLFHKVIAMSGSMTHRLENENLFWTRKMARSTACPMYNPKDLVACLRNVSWERMNEVELSWQTYGLIDIKWTFEVDGYSLLDKPANLFAEGNFHRVPLLTGITKDEMDATVFYHKDNTGLLNDMSINFDKYAPEIFLYTPNAEKSRKIKEFYLKNQTIQDQCLENYGNIFSDVFVGHGVYRLLELTRKYQDVYFYRFDHLGLYSHGVDASGKLFGQVTHADDLQYILPSKSFGGQNGEKDTEMWMVERMTGLWTSFAKNGVPDDMSGLKWSPSNSTQVHTMYIGRNVSLGPVPYIERYQLWDSLFPVGS